MANVRFHCQSQLTEDALPASRRWKLSASLLSGFWQVAQRRTLSPFAGDFEHQVEDVPVLRHVGCRGILKGPMYPAVNRVALREIGIDGRAESTISSIRLLFAMRLAMIGIHRDESFENWREHRCPSIAGQPFAGQSGKPELRIVPESHEFHHICRRLACNFAYPCSCAQRSSGTAAISSMTGSASPFFVRSTVFR